MKSPKEITKYAFYQKRKEKWNPYQNCKYLLSEGQFSKIIFTCHTICNRLTTSQQNRITMVRPAYEMTIIPPPVNKSGKNIFYRYI